LDVRSDLEPFEFVAAQLRSIHYHRGTFYMTDADTGEVLADQRAPDQAAAQEAASLAGTLPEVDRRAESGALAEADAAPAESTSPDMTTEEQVAANAGAQQQIDRIHALLDVIKQDLSSAKQWAADEIRTILHEAGATASK
jgi:hypothetical protein